VLSVVLNITARSLCAALELGDHDLLQALLQYDVDVNCDADGRIPLIIASKLGHLDNVNKLLEKGAHVNCKDPAGKTPLIIATESGSLDIVNKLLEKGAHVNCKDTVGRTSLIIATESGSLDIVKKLLEEKGVDVNCKDANGKTAADLAASDKIRVIQYIFLNCC
jgi:ankyrin repeat protein